ncbi:DUF3833 domain-containing protein [Alteromonas sp. a30]|uniref:DUF3833 domain-containing protein n=1 Tax=Alteromonas sp. a30 TaxID=2730917 RepID=UPI00227DA592|nr:DUF3833 domain-containing protein [Alteromonas sp. a30]MCY7294838.1 DUF3833 domain-containing protein [Alteromonas sp. a30]
MKTLRTLFPFFAALLLSACSHSPDGERYRQYTPDFDLFAFFDGNVRAWGIVQNYSGDVVQRFTVDIQGTVINDEELQLDESFTYMQGEGVKQRVWRLKQTKDGLVHGQADDIHYPATGQRFGNAFQFTYDMDLPVDDSYYLVSFDDWMWMIDNNTLMNRSYIKKWGVVVAEVTIFMQKQPM